MTANTPKSLMIFGVSSTAMIETPLITSKLKAADPTMVDGPKTGGRASRSCIVCRTERRISGADDPKAIRVRFATVSFHLGTSIL